MICTFSYGNSEACNSKTLYNVKYIFLPERFFLSLKSSSEIGKKKYGSIITCILKKFWCFIRLFQQNFSYIMATSFSVGGSRSTRREPPTMGKQLVNCITCGCESSAPFLWFTKPGANPRRIGDRLLWTARSNDLTHWATRALGISRLLIFRLWPY